MNHRHDLPLRTDIAARFLPIIVGVMVYLGTLCFVFTLFIIHATHSWEKQFITQLTLEIPTSPQTASAPLQARALQVLNKTPGVQHAEAVSQKEIASLLQSLLGTDAKVDLQALPVLIEVSLNGQETVDVANLEAHLKNISPQIQVVDHRSWQTQVSGLINTSVLLASMLTGLILLAALITTTFATRTSLLIHRHVIEVLHLMGATNSYIARQFQIHVLKQGLIASTVGSLIAFLTFTGVAVLLEKAGVPFALHLSFFSQALCIFILAPFVTGFSMMLSARWTVMQGLRS
jgi:cell division transport system permease protein